MQSFVHYFLHFAAPLFIALIFFKKEWKKVYLLMLATMLVDLDHLLASPIFQANRCSIGYHPLHSIYALVCYCLMLFLPKPYRIIGIGLLFHMFTDLVDCSFIYQSCTECIIPPVIRSFLDWLM